MPEGGIEDVTFSDGLSIEGYDKSSVSIRLDYSLSEKTTFTATFAGPHTGPSLCSNKAGLISLWYTEGSGTGIYYAEKRENDNTFSQRQLVSNDGHHPQLCASDDRVAMLWEENVRNNGQAKTEIRYV